MTASKAIPWSLNKDFMVTPLKTVGGVGGSKGTYQTGSTVPLTTINGTEVQEYCSK